MKVTRMAGIALFALLATTSARAQASAPQVAAVIDAVESEPGVQPEVEVLRIESGEFLPGAAKLELFEGDELRTGPQTRVTLVFLDDVAEQDKVVHLQAESHVIIETRTSVFVSLGSVFAQLRGFFDVKLSDLTLGATGTEFQVRAGEDGKASLLVLEGEVGLHPFRAALNETLARAAAFAKAEPPSGERLQLDSGASSDFQRTIRITNNCGRSHVFEVDRRSNVDWVELRSDVRVDLDPGETRDVLLDIEADAEEAAAGLYPANFGIRCLDCAAEPGCRGDIESAVELLIDVAAPLRAQRLQQVDLAPGRGLPDQPAAASDAAVEQAVDWSTEMILAARPSFPAASVFPAYESAQERDQAFRDARRRALAGKDAEAYARIGAAYADWGRGARALTALTFAGELDPSRFDNPDYLVKRARAERMAGRLEQAGQLLESALAAGPDASALNERGALYLDWAERSEFQGDPAQAESFLELAVEFFAQASAAPESALDDSLRQAITLTNQAKTQNAMGALTRQRGRLEQARVQLRSAQSSLQAARAMRGDYPFAPLELGRAFLELGRLEAAQSGEAAPAAQAFWQRAEEAFRDPASQHPDMAAAYGGLGQVALARGQRSQALQYFRQALSVDVRYTPAYRQLGTLLQQEDPAQAARYLETFRQLLPKAVRPEPGLPRLIGLNLDDARRELRRSGYRLGKTTLRPSPEGDNTVLAQSPEAGAEVPRGRKVDLVLAGPRGPIAVPEVEGKPLADAVAALEKAGFRVSIVEKKKPSKPEGSIHDQDPEGGEKLMVGSEVVLEVAVSVEPGKARVPQLEGMSRGEAEAALASAGFRLGEVREKESRRPPGTVIDQKPDAGKERKKGKKVDLEIAVPRQVKIPGLKDKRLDEAEERLAARGLGIGRIEETPSCRSPGRVLRQNPEKGQRVVEGHRVDLVIGGLGEDPAIVPDLRGMHLEQASQALSRAGLRAGSQRNRESEERPGTVLSQDPRPGERLPRGCPVDIVAAKAITLVRVPDLRGLDEVQARRALSPSLLLGRIAFAQSAGQPGRVMEQSPVPGSKVRPGSRVDVVVSVPVQATLVTVPRLQDMTLEQAERTLGRAGLMTGRIVRKPGSASPRVVAQSPPAGSRVRRGTRVDLQLGGGTSPSRPADLVAQLRQAGNFRQTNRGFEVPVAVQVRNLGGSPASAFKIEANYDSGRGRALVPFLLNGRNLQHYVWLRQGLAAGGSREFRASLLFSSRLEGQSVVVRVVADSCSGDEFTAAHCRVQESNENNNTSNAITIVLKVID